MKVKQKNSPTYVISLTEEEALKLFQYLGNTVVLIDQTANAGDLNDFSVDLMDELEELLEAKAIL